MKKLKDEKFREYAIKIYRVREVYALDAGGKDYKEKMFWVDIENYLGSKIGFSVKIDSYLGKSLRKVFKRIQEELHII